MRKLYGLDSAAGEAFLETGQQPLNGTVAIDQTQIGDSGKEFSSEQVPLRNENRAIFPSAAGRESEIEDQEVKDLFRWTQELNFEDVSRAIGSGRSRDDPRLGSTPWSSRAVYTHSG